MQQAISEKEKQLADKQEDHARLVQQLNVLLEQAQLLQDNIKERNEDITALQNDLQELRGCISFSTPPTPRTSRTTLIRPELAAGGIFWLGRQAQVGQVGGEDRGGC